MSRECEGEKKECSRTRGEESAVGKKEGNVVHAYFRIVDFVGSRLRVRRCRTWFDMLWRVMVCFVML